MTNQQLKAHCEDVIANPQDHEDWVVDMARVALASLEAQPVGYFTYHEDEDGDPTDFIVESDSFAKNSFKLYRSLPAPELKQIDLEQDEAAFEKGVSALIDCLEDCGDAEQGLRLALRAMTGAKS